MEIKNNSLLLAFSFALGLSSSQAHAENVVMNTAQMQALDKITGQMSIIDVPVGGEVSFGSFSIVARSCQSNPPEDIPENYAFIDIADKNRDGKVFNIFKGWMVSSSPSLNSVEHPIYDVWLLKCHNTADAGKKLLTQQQLDERDKLEKMQEDNLSKEAKIAQALQKEQAVREAQEKANIEEQQRINAESQERQEALDKEIKAQQDVAPQTETSVMNNDQEGPVSLLNIGQQNKENLDDTPAAVPANTMTEEKQNAETAVAIEIKDESGSDIIVIEDTHHETVDHDWNLPDDIDEVLPSKQE